MIYRHRQNNKKESRICRENRKINAHRTCLFLIFCHFFSVIMSAVIVFIILMFNLFHHFGQVFPQFFWSTYDNFTIGFKQFSHTCSSILPMVLSNGPTYFSIFLLAFSSSSTYFSILAWVFFVFFPIYFNISALAFMSFCFPCFFVKNWKGLLYIFKNVLRGLDLTGYSFGWFCYYSSCFSFFPYLILINFSRKLLSRVTNL